MSSLVCVLLILGAALLALLTDAGASFLVEARLLLGRVHRSDGYRQMRNTHTSLTVQEPNLGQGRVP